MPALAQIVVVILSALGVEVNAELRQLVIDNLAVALTAFAAFLGALAKLIEVFLARKAKKEEAE